METKKISLLGVFDNKGDLRSIVYHQEKKRVQVVCGVVEYGQEEIETLLNAMKNVTVK